MLVVVVIILGASVILYLMAAQGLTFTRGSSTTTTSTAFNSTVTTTETLPCVTSSMGLTNITTASTAPSNGGENETSLLASLLGNFSEMSTVFTSSGPGGPVVATSSFVVLNRSTVAGVQIDEINSTTEVSFANEVVQSSGNYTTTVVGPGNVTNAESMLVLFESNGTVIPVNNASGNENLGESGSSLISFLPIVAQSNLISSSGTSKINSTTVTIGSTKMQVTNYQRPSLVEYMTNEGCNSTAFTETISIFNTLIQAGIVPGTNFTLVTQYKFDEESSLSYSNSSSSSSSSGSELFLDLRVTSFTVA